MYHKAMTLLIFGLTNTAANCYFNSLMQCLLMTDNFNQPLLAEQEPNILNHLEKENSHFIAYYKVLKYIREYNNGKGNKEKKVIFNLKGVRKIFIEQSTQFREDLQGDSGEFLTYFLDKIHEEIKRDSATSTITDIFNIKMAQEVFCNSCKHQNLTYQNNLQLFVTPKESTDIADSIREEIDGTAENIAGFVCEKCQGTDCIQRQKIAQWPEILIVIIKRYHLINTSVTVPYSINIVEKNIEYKLYGAVCHRGSLNSGHYWAVCNKKDKWYIFDDDMIRPIPNISHQYFTRAYVLFYAKSESSEHSVVSSSPSSIPFSPVFATGGEDNL